MTPVLFAAAAFLPVTLMVAVAVLRGAVGLTNRFLAGDPPPDDRLRSAWYDAAAEGELPEPGVVAAVVPTLAAVAVAAAALFGYAYVSEAFTAEATVRPVELREVLARMAAPAALLGAVPIFLVFRTRALAGLLRTSFPRAASVVAFEVLIWGTFGASVMGLRAAAGYGTGLLV